MGNSLKDRVAKLEKELQSIKEEMSVKIRKGLKVGDTFKLAGLEWKILDITDKGYFCHAMDRYGSDRTFDPDSSDWKTSDLRKELNEKLLKEISEEIGEENIIPFDRDLLSLDGQTEYGTCEDKISLLTVDEYRKYRSMLPNTDDYWWWLITPWSTPCNDYKNSVTVVSPLGSFFRLYCYFRGGVRPVCIFSSLIFKSEND
jgi:hypothetical protein